MRDGPCGVTVLHTARNLAETLLSLSSRPVDSPGLLRVTRDWGWIGITGFGGPPAHIALLRRLCVERRGWIAAQEFEDAIAACNLLPGPASTQLAIFCAWRVRGRLGGLVGGLAFVLPGLVAILALSALFLASSPPRWILGAGAGAGAAVAAVAVQAGWSLVPESRRRARSVPRWVVYLLAGGVSAATIGPWLVLVLVGCGLAELALSSRGRRTAPRDRPATCRGRRRRHCRRSRGWRSRSAPSPTAEAS